MFLYFRESDFTIFGFSTAMEPIIKLLIPRSKYLNVQEGDFVKRGDILVEGTPVPHDILRVLGIEE